MGEMRKPNKKCEKCTEVMYGQLCQCKTCVLNDICTMALDENCAVCMVCQQYCKLRE